MDQPLLPLSKRIASVLVSNASSKRKAQMDMPKHAPKVDPSAKMLDELYSALSDEDCSSALDCLYKLTSHLDLGDEVSFDVPDKEDDNEHPESLKEDKPFAKHKHEDKEEEEPEHESFMDHSSVED